MLPLCLVSKNATQRALCARSMFKTWHPAKALKASAAVHVGAVAALGVGVAWPWPLGALLANHAVLTAAGLWPRSTLLGDNMSRLPQVARDAMKVAITLDDGPNPDVTPLVLDILDKYKAKASFFCVGRAVETYPSIARDIVRRGHSIENHSYAHKHYFSVMGMGALRREIVRAQEAIVQVTGHQPIFFRAPAGLRSPLLDPVLQDLNLKLVSWTRRGFDTVTTEPAPILARLERNLSTGDILLLHDGNSAKTWAGRPVVLDVLPKILETLRRAGLQAGPLNYVANKT
jgi:peptidoglycan-N-acetylglucosamine deacetylase